MSNDTCSITDCPLPTHARGLCGPHYRDYLDTLPGRPTCTVDDCPEVIYCRELCSIHYNRMRRAALLPTRFKAPKDLSDEDRFWRRVSKDGPLVPDHPEMGPCWLWTGPVAPDWGYGRHGKRNAHRVAWEFTFGEVPDGLVTSHLCHLFNPDCEGIPHQCIHRLCCNPSHLEAITEVEKTRRGRTAEACRQRAKRQREAPFCPRGHERVDGQCHQCIQQWGQQGAAKRYATLLRAWVEDVDILVLAERDRWVCGICGSTVDSVLKWPDPGYRTMDHIIPISRGGEHSYANTRLAHYRCNSQRGAAVGESMEELRLALKGAA